ncbi:MAG: hypothetical protein HY248_01200 [Fimbriimonas ginsengisoli]|uniref:BPL/LPL catalytic domain-containing protein n=1 Tax=Fimbriimonas ginsengisoli TaxID=1005039 RepID=A0A931PWF6_FIMGI|nr:hypothetical protein [Fimbriimonas ginsengisoli]MBI3721144.1 hypothetical protein [Fimbriimonas ginsengisoli]
MARDAELLVQAEAGQPGCRVYGWDGVWVSLGRFQSAERDLLNPSETNWVMRPTGGKAVLHGHDVTVGLAVPLATLGLQGAPRALRLAYAAVARPIVEALRACGLPAVLAEQRGLGTGKTARTADCFAHTSPNDIVDERTGLKVCGCALRLTQRAVLVQASIPARPPLVDPKTIIRGASASVAWIAWDSCNFATELHGALDRRDA